MLDKLHDATLRYMVANEGPTTTSNEHLTIQSEKVSVKSLGQSKSKAQHSEFKLPGAEAFGLGKSKDILILMFNCVLTSLSFSELLVSFLKIKN